MAEKGKGTTIFKIVVGYSGDFSIPSLALVDERYEGQYSAKESFAGTCFQKVELAICNGLKRLRTHLHDEFCRWKQAASMVPPLCNRT